MEIKDVNSLTNMIMNKSAAVSGASAESAAKGKNAGAEFLSLLNQQELFDPATTDIAASRPENSKKTAPVSKNKNKPAVAAQEKTAKDDKPVKNDNKDKKASAADSSPVAEKPAQTESKKDNQTTQNSENKDVSADSSGNAQISGQDKSQPQNPTEGTKDAVDGAVVEDAAAGTETAAPETKKASELTIQILDMGQLAQMGAVTVFNVETNSYSVMTGAEIAALINSGETNLVPVLSSDGKSDVSLLPLTAQPSQPETQASAEGVDISSMAPAVEIEEAAPEIAGIVKDQIKAHKNVAGDNAAAEAAETSVPAPQADAEIVKQAEELGKNISRDKTIDVKVNVEEENFSYSPAKENFAVKQVMQDSTADAEMASQKAPSSTASDKATAANANGNGQVQQLNLFNAAPALQPGTAESGQNTAAAALSAAGKAETAVLPHNAAAADMAQSVRAEVRAEADAKTSFRDVYKGMGKEAVEQIKVNITKSAVKGVDKINVQLKPEELGHIEIKMQIAKDGKLQAHIISSRAETFDMLQKEIPSLEKAFQDAGFDADSSSFSFSFREDGQAGEQQEQNRGLRSFLGDVLEKEAGNENLAADLFSYENWDGKSALNIRV